MNQKVQDDIQELSANYHYSWLDPIIQVENDVQNPYFDESQNNLNNDPNFIQNSVGGIYAQHENIINFTFNDYTSSDSNKKTEKDDSKQFEFSQFVTQTQSLSDIINSNSVLKFSSSFNLQSDLPAKAPPILGFTTKSSIKMDKIECPFDFVEPVMFSAFLYNLKSRTIISEVWNFFPEQSIPFLKNFSSDLNSFQSATFEVDTAKNLSITLFILISHPITKDRGQAAINYYLNPNSDNAQLVQKEKAKYPNQIVTTFTTFGFVFFDYRSISSSKIPQQSKFYIIDKLPPESQLTQLISDVNGRKLKTIGLKIFMCRGETESPLIIQQIALKRPQPYFNPKNKLVLRIDKLTTSQVYDSSSSQQPPIDCGYTIKIECVDNNNTPIEAIQSIFDPTKCTKAQMTNVCFPPVSPSLNESFILNLPYPLNPSSAIKFTLYKCSYTPDDKYKDKDKGSYTIDEIGSQSFPLIDDGALPDESSKTLTFAGEYNLSIRIYTNSNAYVPDKNLNSFLSSKENPPFSLLSGVSSTNLVVYLYPILNQFLRKLNIFHDNDFVEEFIKVCNTITTVVDNNSLSTFFLAFVRFFAFTTTEVEDAKKLATPVQIPTENPDQMNLGDDQPEINVAQIGFSQMQFHQKLFVILTTFLTKHSDGIDLLAPYFDFFFTLIAKYISIDKSTQKIFSDEFGIFTLQFIKFALPSSNLSQLVRSYAIFVNLLYDSGFSDVAIIAVRNVLMSWPDTSNSINESDIYIKSKNDFIETLFRPSLFALLVKNSKDFQNIVIGLIKSGYDSIASSPEPSRLFEILMQLTEIYDAHINQIISSELVSATVFFKPNLFFNKDSVFPPLIYFLYLLLNCKKAPSNKKIFEGLHFLLTKVSKQDTINETKNSINADSSQKANSQADGKRKSKKSGTFVNRKKNSDLAADFADLQNANQAYLQNAKDEKKNKIFMNYTNKSVFDLIVKLEQSDDAQIPCIISLIFHLVIVTKEIESLEKMIFILNYYMQKFKMKFINTVSPALVRILSKLFSLSIGTTTKTVTIPMLPPLRQNMLDSNTPSSSRNRARATSFSAAKIASLEQGKTEYNEAPENTSFRQKRNPFNSSEPNSPRQAQANIAAQYASEAVQISNFDTPTNNNGSKRRTTFAKPLTPPDDSESDSAQMNDNTSQASMNAVKISPLVSNNSNNPEENMNKINTVIAEFINSTFTVDLECNKNNNRSSAIFIRAISSLNEEQLTSNSMENLLFNHAVEVNKQSNNQALTECLEIYRKINEIAKKMLKNTKSKKFTYEEHSELLFRLFRLFAKSPDAQVECLEKLYDLHMKEGSPFEAANVSIVQAAIILENLTNLHKIPNYFRLSHPCFVLKEICAFSDTVQCPDYYRKDPPLVPGFCDSFMFNEQGFISLLYRALDVCSKNKILKFASMLIDLCWPIFEYWQSFDELQVMFSKFHDIFSSLVEDAEGQDAFADRFFRVTFFGQKLDESNQKTYIYRQKPLTHLYDFTNNIISKYGEIYGKDNIIQISESGKVDTSKLDLVNKIYIQITFVEPYTHGSKERERKKDKEYSDKVKNDLFTQFFYDTPFVKTDDNKSNIGKAHQATMDKQWIRKTILPTNFELPSLLIRSEVDPSNIIEKDSEPIKVVCKQIRDRTKQLEKAIDSNDMMKTQQLLHGSLLVQVNEGPAKIADVFLGDETKNKSKSADNLREAFIYFMRQLRKGVSVHAQLTSQNPEFQPLQEELEAGYESLKNKLAPLCIKSSIKASFSSFANASTQILKAASQASNLVLYNTNDNSSMSSIIDSQSNTAVSQQSSPIKGDIKPTANSE